MGSELELSGVDVVGGLDEVLVEVVVGRLVGEGLGVLGDGLRGVAVRDVRDVKGLVDALNGLVGLVERVRKLGVGGDVEEELLALVRRVRGGS